MNILVFSIGISLISLALGVLGFLERGVTLTFTYLFKNSNVKNELEDSKKILLYSMLLMIFGGISAINSIKSLPITLTIFGISF